MPTTPDRYLIAIGQKIEPHIYRSRAEAESAAETLAYRTGKETATYRLSDAGCVSLWIFGADATSFIFRTAHLPFRPDGSSWLERPNSVTPVRAASRRTKPPNASAASSRTGSADASPSWRFASR